VSDIDILDESSEGKRDQSRHGLYKDVIWLWEIKDSKVLTILRNALRKWMDAIENFSQYIARRIQDYGLVTEMTSNIYPIHDGFTLTITMKIKGIREDVLEKKLKFIRRQLQGKYGKLREYRKAYEAIEERREEKREGPVFEVDIDE